MEIPCTRQIHKAGREVAVKVLPVEMADDPERLERFQREARALATLDQPNIAPIFSLESADFSAGDSTTEPRLVHFLFMGLVEGQTLDQKIPAGAPAFRQVCLGQCT